MKRTLVQCRWKTRSRAPRLRTRHRVPWATLYAVLDWITDGGGFARGVVLLSSLWLIQYEQQYIYFNFQVNVYFLELKQCKNTLSIDILISHSEKKLYWEPIATLSCHNKVFYCHGSCSSITKKNFFIGKIL